VELMVGISAGQVVAHSHFHVVPRFREFSSASMFGMYHFLCVDLGKGRREELDDDEGREISGRVREVVERELKKENAKL
jgi:diadenosine tetraphosphate (Ap4A) HIT family hydrolase